VKELQGHQLSVYLKSQGKPKDRIECSCGWRSLRLKIRVPKGDKGVMRSVDETLEAMRQRGRQHLYDVWKESRQTKLEVDA
jgi:hypothetical protein